MDSLLKRLKTIFATDGAQMHTDKKKTGDRSQETEALLSEFRILSVFIRVQSVFIRG
jgi:hypothetical protein